MAPTATAPAMSPSDLIHRANALDALEDRTPEQDAELASIKETIDTLSQQELARLSQKPPAEQIADAEHPDRPEGAADDASSISQAEREATADWSFDGDDEPAAAADPGPTDGTAYAEPGDVPASEDGYPAGEMPDERPLHERTADASGITADREAGEAQIPDPEPAPAPDGQIFDPGPTEDEYDLAIWQSIVGGRQPDTRKVAIKSLPSLVLENSPPLRNGAELELRVVARVTGFGSDDKLKEDKDTGEIALKETVEKRTLTAIAATVLTGAEDDALEADISAIVEKAVRAGMEMRKNANDDAVAAAVAEVLA